MTRQDIFQILKNKYNTVQEINKIISLFESIYIGYTDYYGHKSVYNLEEFINAEILPKWKQRDCYLSCKEIQQALDIPKQFCPNVSIDKIIIALEYYENLFYLLIIRNRVLGNSYYEVPKNFELMVQNSHLLIERLNYEITLLEKEEKVLLIPKNPSATAVAELSTDETALAILKYHHTSLKGDLEGKGNLLYQISLEYEPLLKTPIEGYNDFFEKTNALLNNLHIRHNNKTKEHNKNKIININDQKLEKWYDELYQLLLFCILIKDNLERKNNVDKLLKELKGAKA